MISLTFVKNSIPVVPMAHWVGQQGSEAVRSCSSLSFQIILWKAKGFPNKIFRFGPVRQKTFDKTVMPLPPLHEKIRCPKISKTLKGSPANICGTVRQNKFNGKLWQPPALLCMKFFVTGSFLKHIRVPLQFFSVVWNKKYRQKTVMKTSYA